MPDITSPTSSRSSSFDPYTSDANSEQRDPTHNSGSDPTRQQHVVMDHNSDPNRGELAMSGPAFEEGTQHTSSYQVRKRKRSTDAFEMPMDPSQPYVDDFNGQNRALGSAGSNSMEYPQKSNKRVKSTEPSGFLTQPREIAHPQGAIPFDRSNLPGEIWQHIFTFLPPTSLGRILCVNKVFNSLLAPNEAEFPDYPQTLGSLRYINPDSIWSASRKAYHPGMPRPISFLNELDMWKLVYGSACQFCAKYAPVPPSDNSPWEAGPGLDGARIIWPFGVRSCGECIQAKSEKEMDLLLSSNLPSLLIPSLPFAFFTPSMHFASSITLRSNNPPPGMALTKYFFKPHIADLRRKFEDVKSLGPATTEEWIKGLEDNGKEKLADAARLEQWEASGGLQSLEIPRANRAQSLGLPSTDLDAKNLSIDTHSGHSTPLANDKGTNGQDSPSTSSNSSGSKLPQRPSSRDSNQHSAPSTSTPHHRTERSLREVNEAKANRKAEIERRCLALVPPLTPGVLSHMDSFSAAIQIPHPFTDRDWAILKPRLLSQRDIAERREQDRLKQDQLLQAKSEERRHQDAQLKEAKEQLDREWEEVQKPIRDRMALYADEIIREGWRGGDGVTKEKCPKFAADVLMYVKDRFYRDLTQEDARARNSGKPIPEDPPGAPPTRKLILENMKWIFDTKIKPLTEKFQKELFLCNGCENNTKYYGFEGVVQHYAAKHTNVLSLGSVVVHWRAEWPEQPPFHPDPVAAKALFYAMPRPIMGQPHGYNQQHGHIYMPRPDQGHHHPDGAPGYPQASPGPYNRTPYGTPYAYGSGPYRPPSPAAPPFYPPQQPNFAYSQPQPRYPPNGGYDPYAPPQPPNPMYGSPYPGQAYPPPYPTPDARTQGYQPPPYPPPTSGPPQYGPPYPNNSNPSRRGGHAAGAHNSNPNSQAFGMHQVQLDDIAKNARSVWNGTSGIRDLPHSVRAHVLIQHVVSRFVDRFGSEPPLALFAEGLNNHAQMKPIRNLSGLVCKACGDIEATGRPHHNDGGRSDRKMYTLPALASHFQSMHIERPKSIAPHPGAETPKLEWQDDMLSLPDNSIIAALVDAPGMDETKMQLVAFAFPWVFPPPPSSTHTPTSNLSDKRQKETREARQSNRPYRNNAHRRFAEEKYLDAKPTVPSPNRGIEVVVDNFPRFVDSPTADSNKPLDPPKEDEYDPHRPGFIEPVRDQYRGRADTHRSKLSQASIISPEDKHAARGQNTTYGNRGAPTTRTHRGHPSGAEDTDIPPVDRQRYREAGPPSKAPAQYRDHLPKSEFPQSTGIGASEPRNEPQKPGSPLRNVSEDGEVEESKPVPEIGIGTERAAPEEMTDAERFLSSFVPGQENEDYRKGTSRGTDRRADEPPRGKWLDAPDTDDRRWRPDGTSGGTAESSVAGTPTRGKQHGGWNRGRSPMAGGFREMDTKHEHFENGGISVPRHVEERSPEPSDYRHGRKPIGFSDARHQSDHQARRPHSRFDRYEAQTQRHGSHRPRSRSPVVHDPLPLEQTYYRERSPRAKTRRPVYTGHSPDPYLDRGPTDHAVSYTRVPPRGPYQYVEEPRYVEPPYDGSMEYIPVRVGAREHQNAGAYYIERPVQREAPAEYVDYEMDYSRQPVLEHHGQYYAGDSVPQNAPGAMPRHSRYR
ncbi:hypothetical protein FQN55_001415 [Onygenales sp. PD_40]|nr:hypothetical protein FQN55_001415 [Onygenales sp. PD_40]KAK2796060.1 hypothetical protein FQN52_000033 [Onygenales sp. PD_12]